ncbi:MAG: molybdenum cofactor biosynthesis protein MoaE [Alkalispirochaeta sp.]
MISISRPVGFAITEERILPTAQHLSERIAVEHPEIGGVVVFEGRVRNHHNGRGVSGLEYTAYHELAVYEGLRIVRETAARLELPVALAIHRVGAVPIGEMAVWVYAGGAHRQAAFEGCRVIIDEIKRSVPIWKHEWYEDGSDEWVLGNPE